MCRGVREECQDVLLVLISLMSALIGMLTVLHRHVRARRASRDEGSGGPYLTPEPWLWTTLGLELAPCGLPLDEFDEGVWLPKDLDDEVLDDMIAYVVKVLIECDCVVVAVIGFWRVSVMIFGNW